ncbi:ISKra4 family transposase [Gemmata obscuriglobus]|uniref:ISKra4 family transposase n=1 Tax=Gemmata obscuriglobus TaxID=114 RepID=UPI001E39EC8F|nr:ISKra4 family transposase [Gemmata obscuriglobus]
MERTVGLLHRLPGAPLDFGICERYGSRLGKPWQSGRDTDADADYRIQYRIRTVGLGTTAGLFHGPESSGPRSSRRHGPGRLREACTRSRAQTVADHTRCRLGFTDREGRAKRGRARTCAKTHPGRSKGPHTRTVVTAVGPIELERRYFHCPTCGQGEFGADRGLGLSGYVTPGACRMAVLLGVQQSFAKAEVTLAEVVGWELDDNTIRQLCHATAAQATATRQHRSTAEVFTRAQAAARTERPVDSELHIDAGKVNTVEDGWRDLKMAVFARRERSAPTTAMDWEGRDLPTPLARSVIAAVEEASLFGKRCHDEATRLEWTDSSQMTVLGDGAEWLWNVSEQHFRDATQVLDFWHGAEYLASGAKAVFGPGVQAATAFVRGKSKLLEDGYPGLVDWIGELTGQMPAGGDGAALGGVLNYFCGQQGRLNYAVRLRRGQSIGSGLVEGTVKQLLNIRMKQTGARWNLGHVAPFVELGALAAGPEWKGFWENQ